MKLYIRLAGPAGTAKTAIARALVQLLQTRGVTNIKTQDLTQGGPIELEGSDALQANAFKYLAGSGTEIVIQTLQLRQIDPNPDNRIVPMVTVDEAFHPDAQALFRADAWSEHGDFPRADWRQEVGNGDTQRSYWGWVSARLDERAQENGR